MTSEWAQQLAVEQRLDVQRVGSVPVLEALYEAETVIVYRTSVPGLGVESALGYRAFEGEGERWDLVAPIGESRLQDLLDGALPVREALMSSAIWLIRRSSDGTPTDTWMVRPGQIPNEWLPSPGTPLHAEHEPVIRTRAVGAGINAGNMPASVVAFVADSTRKAIKVLLEADLSGSSGRPTKELRTLYDLPIQRFAFNSFEVAFGAPAEVLFDGDLQKAAELLAQGLRWAADPTSDPPPGSNDAERAAVTRAALLLTPPSSGVVVQVEVSGRWLAEKVKLTRDSRRKVRTALRNAGTQVSVVRYEGYIGEADRDNGTLILRNEPDVERRATFEPDLFDDVADAFREGYRVEVTGVQAGDRLSIDGIIPSPHRV